MKGTYTEQGYQCADMSPPQGLDANRKEAHKGNFDLLKYEDQGNTVSGALRVWL